ncbi:hypothetical protein AB1Y20_015021 [Prymnesium parvum]|uniref:Uncharacterized protein n=1 Tax=Prymnesium parvum TaxID=97485 RepID=A0AB34JZ57_PRYPA
MELLVAERIQMAEERLSAVETRQTAAREAIAAAEREVQRKEAAVAARLAELDARLAGKVQQEVSAHRVDARDALRAVMSALAREEDRRAAIDAATERRVLREEIAWRAELLAVYKSGAKAVHRALEGAEQQVREVKRVFDEALASVGPAVAQQEAGLSQLGAEMRLKSAQLEQEVQQQTTALKVEIERMREEREGLAAREEEYMNCLTKEMREGLDSYCKDIEGVRGLVERTTSEAKASVAGGDLLLLELQAMQKEHTAALEATVAVAAARAAEELAQVEAHAGGVEQSLQAALDLVARGEEARGDAVRERTLALESLVETQSTHHQRLRELRRQRVSAERGAALSSAAEEGAPLNEVALEVKRAVALVEEGIVAVHARCTRLEQRLRAEEELRALELENDRRIGEAEAAVEEVRRCAEATAREGQVRAKQAEEAYVRQARDAAEVRAQLMTKLEAAQAECAVRAKEGAATQEEVARLRQDAAQVRQALQASEVALAAEVARGEAQRTQEQLEAAAALAQLRGELEAVKEEAARKEAEGAVRVAMAQEEAAEEVAKVKAEAAARMSKAKEEIASLRRAVKLARRSSGDQLTENGGSAPSTPVKAADSAPTTPREAAGSGAASPAGGAALSHAERIELETRRQSDETIERVQRKSQRELAELQSALADARREGQRLQAEQQQLASMRKLGAFHDAFASRVQQTHSVADASDSIDAALANALNAMSLPLKVTCNRVSKGVYRFQCGGASTSPAAKRSLLALGPTGTVFVRDGSSKQIHITQFMLHLCRAAIEGGAAVSAAAQPQLEGAEQGAEAEAAAGDSSAPSVKPAAPPTAKPPAAAKPASAPLLRQQSASKLPPASAAPRAAQPRGKPRVCVSLDDEPIEAPAPGGEEPPTPVPVATIDLTQ